MDTSTASISVSLSASAASGDERNAGVPASADCCFQASGSFADPAMATVLERREPMVDLAAYGFKCVPVYFHNGWTENSQLYARRSVAEKLAAIQARVLAPRGVRWLVWDAWRSRQTQAAVYQHYWRDLSAKHSKLSVEDLTELVQTFVTVPDRADFAPPHTTGGSIDLGLWDNARGMPLELGADFDEFCAEAASHAFEAPGKDETVRDWRRLMARSLADYGFTGDPHEYFHKDFGNQRWAARIDCPIAFYGEVASVEPNGTFMPGMTLAADELPDVHAKRLAALREGLDLAHPATETAALLTPPKLLALA